MTVRFELFAAGSPPPDRAWALVGDPRRLPEWTDADRVTRVDPEPVAVGSRIDVVVGDRTLRWQVTTAEPRLLEAVTDSPRGRIGIGVRVVPDPLGCRIILAGALDPPTGWPRLRARIVDAPALRRRFDRWAPRALREAAR